MGINIANRVIANPANGGVKQSFYRLETFPRKFSRVQHYLLFSLSSFLGAYLAGYARLLAVCGEGSLRSLASGGS